MKRGSISSEWRVECFTKGCICVKSLKVDNPDFTDMQFTSFLLIKNWRMNEDGHWVCPQCTKGLDTYKKPRKKKSK